MAAHVGPTAGLDFRSDTVTKPTLAMGQAMLAACADPALTGDDVMGEDATVKALEARVAALLGKEAALFVPTCTMANLLAVGAHCARGDEVVCGTESHVFVYEQGGASWLMGTAFHTVPNDADGTLPLPLVQAALALRGGGADAHHARSGLVCIENTANRCGGSALPAAYVAALGALARSYGVPLHCDGARLLNAAAALGVAPTELVAACDSVSLCLSKGLGAPLGALLAGSAAVVARARRLRKAVGGGMRQAGVVAASGLVALDSAHRLGEDHALAASLAAGLRGVEGLDVQARVDSNIVYFGLGARWSVEHWRRRCEAAVRAGADAVVDPVTGARVPLDAVAPGAEVALSTAFCALMRAASGVRVGGYGGAKVRAVTHHQVDAAAVAALVRGAGVCAHLLSE